MKLHGKRLPQNKVHVVLPRPDGDLVFEMRAILDYSDFETLCPVPRPPMTGRPGEQARPDLDDAGYQTAFKLWLVKKNDFIILKSLEHTPGIEWDTVNMNDPSTWKNYHAEFLDASLTPKEINRIIEACYEVNGLDDEKIEEARKRFHAALAAAQG